MTWTGDVDVGSAEVGFTSAVPSKAGDPAFVAMLSDPVLNIALSTEEERGGSDVGAVTPGNPVTPVHVPTGSVSPAVCADEAGEEVVPVWTGDVVAAVPVACGVTDDAGVVEEPCTDVDVPGTDVEDVDAVPRAVPVVPVLWVDVPEEVLDVEAR